MATVIINRERCKGCGLCIDVCPRKILFFAEEVNRKGVHPVRAKTPDQCSGCRLCVTVCPDVAIKIIDE